MDEYDRWLHPLSFTRFTLLQSEKHRFSPTFRQARTRT
jgi:hypothetical protein